MKHLVFIILNLFSCVVFAQSEDCLGAIPVCGNGDIALTPTGSGVNDFANPNNHYPDCFINGSDFKTTWLRVKVETAGTLGFVILPNKTGVDVDDYDFAVFKSDDCNNLGHSIRCSIAVPRDTTGKTGLSSTETDKSENEYGNSFVRWIDDAEPNDVYYILVDNYTGGAGYKLRWEGSAGLANSITKDEGGVDLGPDLELCENETLVLDATVVGGTDYSWSTGDKNPTLTIDKAGTYTVNVTNSSGCTSTDTIEVKSLPLPVINSVSVSPNNSCGIVNVEFKAEGTAGTYEWFDPNGTKIGEGKTLSRPNQTDANSGEYTVKLSNASCAVEEKVQLNLLKDITLTVSGTMEYCENDTIDISVSGAESYKWYAPNGDEINTTEVWQKSAALTDVGEYKVVGTSAGGTCVDEVTFVIAVEPALEVKIVNTPDVVCVQDNLVLEAEVNNPSATIQWLDPNNDVVGTNLTITLTNADYGIYTVVATSTECEVKESIEIRQESPYFFEEDVTNCSGEPFEVPQTGELVTEAKRVEVKYVTAGLCDSTYVYNVDFFSCGEKTCTGIPTSFAPNRNGENERFRPIFNATCEPISFLLEVYNSWGQKIVTVTDAQEGWDGTHNGEPALPGEYIWQMRYIFPDNPEEEFSLSGSVTIVR